MEKDVTVVIGDACLGGIVDRVLLHAFVGPDAMIMNWLVNIYGGRGVVYSLPEKEISTLSDAEEFLASTLDASKFIKFKAGVLLTTLFVFFTTTVRNIKPTNKNLNNRCCSSRICIAMLNTDPNDSLCIALLNNPISYLSVSREFHS